MIKHLETFLKEFEERYGVTPSIGVNVHRLKKSRAKEIAESIAEQVNSTIRKSDGWFNVETNILEPFSWALFYDKTPSYKVTYLEDGEEKTAEIYENDLDTFYKQLQEIGAQVLSVLPNKD